MIPYGGSKQSGYIQRLIAETPALFELAKVRNPSANLQTRFAIKEAPKRRKLRVEKKSRVNERRNEFFKLLIQFLNSKSTRDYNKFKKEHPEFADKIENIVGAQKGLDFYPTPVECLTGLEDIIRDKNTTSILEPTAGLGNIVNWIEEHKNPKAEVTAIEFNRQFIQPLKELFPDVNVREADFLEYKPATNDFDCIVCNPPFNLVGRKTAYIDFLFKCLHLLNTSSKAGVVFCIFICPTLVEGRYDDGDLFEFREVLEKAKYPVVNRALETVVGKTITKKEFKEYVENGEDNEALEMIEPFESQVFKRECKGFGGTGAQPAVYLFKIINYRRGGRKRRC